jgi:hypothetical protein
LFNILVHGYTFVGIFLQKKIPKETWPKNYLGQDPYPEPDPDLDVFESLIRIQSKIARIRNNGRRQSLPPSIHLYVYSPEKSVWAGQEEESFGGGWIDEKVRRSPLIKGDNKFCLWYYCPRQNPRTSVEKWGVIHCQHFF